MTSVTALELVLLCLASLTAGVVDAIAGGGGLLTLPALLATGLPPHAALATNKGQSIAGTFAALVRFSREGMVDGKRARVTFPLGLAGAFAGAWLVLRVRPEVLRPLVMVLLIAAAAYLTLRRPEPPAPHIPRRVPLQLALGLAALGIGVYDGFFGPGTGTFLILAFVALAGDSLRHASASAKVVNFASNLAAVILFTSRGHMIWWLVAPMAASNLAGGWIGAHLAVKGGDTVVRRVVLVVVIALVLKIGRDVWLGWSA